MFGLIDVMDDSGKHQVQWVAMRMDWSLHASMCAAFAHARTMAMKKCAQAGRRMRAELRSGNRQKTRAF